MKDTVAAIHTKRLGLHISLAGAGLALAKRLWDVGGASATIHDVSLLYAPEALRAALLYAHPELAAQEALAIPKPVSQETANLLCAGRHGNSLAVTAAVATDRERRGADQAFLCLRVGETTTTRHVIFLKPGTPVPKGAVVYGTGLSRTEQDEAIADTAVRMLCEAVGLPRPADTVVCPNPDTDILFFGSFNPVHHGHFGMAELANDTFDRRVVFAMTQSHPDKGNTPIEELERRATNFRYTPTLFTCDDPFYIDKARLFPGVPMLIGADVAAAIKNPRYYPNGDVESVLAEFRALGTCFYVVGREIDGEFVVPPSDDLFVSLPGRWDVRSRDMR